jgi:formate--tetrahydrofolate ligase
MAHTPLPLEHPAAFEPRGRGMWKVDPERVHGGETGRVVLVTAMTPTPPGEGKTTTTVGLVDGLRRRGIKAVGALREPSLGPLFGRKGGAVGGGKSRVEPAENINLHFTGDIHAVTAAHNLLAAVVDNHAFHQREPKLATITWGRVLDMNDRALRTVEVGLSTKEPRKSRFDITAASEVMAVLCVSSSIEDMRARLDRIVVGGTADGRPVTAKDLGASGAMAAVLLDAARPNYVESLEGSPFIVHGGPFANVAQGTSSLMGTKLARKLGDVVVTEAGFAFDLGGFKFLDVKCRVGGFRPAAVVLVATVRALRSHGGAADYNKADVDAVSRGLENIAAHVESMKRLGLPPPIIALNRFPDDHADELALVHARVPKMADSFGAVAVDGTYFADGGAGALGLADAVIDRLERAHVDSPGYAAPYDDGDALPVKIDKVARTVLGAEGAELTERARADLAELTRLGLDKLPICLAKTHLSISDDEGNKARPPPFLLKVSSLRASAGAGFVVVLCGAILTMPGLPKEPAAARIDIERDAEGRWRVKGLS